MQNDKLDSVIKDLNTYHEEKERRYFEKNLFKQKLGKYILFFTILLVILSIVLLLILMPEETDYEEPTKVAFNFIKTINMV